MIGQFVMTLAAGVVDAAAFQLQGDNIKGAPPVRAARLGVEIDAANLGAARRRAQAARLLTRAILGALASSASAAGTLSRGAGATLTIISTSPS